MASCESCHLLVDAEKAVSGVLLCRRCGFLAVLDPTLRALLAIPAFNRAFLNRVPFAIADIVALRDRIQQCEAQLYRARQGQSADDELVSEPSSQVLVSPSAPVGSIDAVRKRKRNTETLESQVSPPPSFQLVEQSSQSQVAPLTAELKALKRQLKELMRQWEQFASETAEQPAPALHQHQHQSFSSTHLNILLAMHDRTGDKLELTVLAPQIEQFLVHQSTLLKMKYDLLAAIKMCREIEQLHAPVFQTDEAALKVTKLLISSTKEQLSHRYKGFQTLSRPYLVLVGAANKHLYALYSAALSLHSMRQTSENEREALIQRELFGYNSGNGSGNSPFIPADHSRSRRRYGSKASPGGSSTSSNMRSTAMGGGLDDVARVQQTLEFGNRIAEISKKVELWRALSSTVATTCVLSISELSLANDAPISA